MEERRTAELLSDFDDYEIADPNDEGISARADQDGSGEPAAHAEKTARKKKKLR